MNTNILGKVLKWILITFIVTVIGGLIVSIFKSVIGLWKNR